MNHEEIRKKVRAELISGAEAQAEREWAAKQAEAAFRQFVEANGGYEAVLAKLKAVYGKRRSRTEVTEEIRKKTRRLLKAGWTAREIAESVGVSVPTVNSMKRLFGMTKPRAK